MAVDVQELKRRVSSYDKHRQEFMDKAKAIAKAMDPRRGRFSEKKETGGERRDKEIINNRAMLARRACVAGLFSGACHPSSPWFKFASRNVELNLMDKVSDWYAIAEREVRQILLDSNFYTTVFSALDEYVMFGTMLILQEDDPDFITRFSTHTFGSYYIVNDFRMDVGIVVIHVKMQARQLVDRFGEANVSDEVKLAIKTNNETQEFEVYQFIEPNPDYLPGSKAPDRLRYRSVCFEKTAKTKALEVSGFSTFIAYAPRWGIVGADCYGSGQPGEIALGDTNQLQEQEKEKAKAIKKMVQPLLQGGAAFKKLKERALDGVVTFNATEDPNGLKPVYTVDPRIQELRADMQGIEQRINEAFFVDLFLNISQMKGIQPRNEMELLQRSAESLMLVGPTLERFQREFLSKVVVRTFQQAYAAGRIPEAPEELQGTELDIRFISSLAQAQRAAEVNLIEQMIQFVGAVAGVNPEAVDKIDLDMAIDKYALYTGVDPTIIRDMAAVQQIREARAQAQAKAAEAEIAAKQGQANQANAQAVAAVAGAARNAQA